MPISPICTGESPSAPPWWFRADLLISSANAKAPASSGAFCVGRNDTGLEIRGDAFVFPVAIARRFRALLPLELFGFGPGVGFGGRGTTRFGLGERTLRFRRQRLASRRRLGRGGGGGGGGSFML